MGRMGRVVGLAPHEDEAEAIRTELSRWGIPAEVHEAEPGICPLVDERFREHVAAGADGLLRGASLGALIGLIVALVVPGSVSSVPRPSCC